MEAATLYHNNHLLHPYFLSTATLKLYFLLFCRAIFYFMNLIYFPVLYAILKQHSMMKLTRLRYATLRICSGLKCLRLYCLRLDGAYRRGLKRRMLIMVLSLQKPPEIFLSAFSYAFSHFSPQPSFDHVNHIHHNPWLFLACSVISAASNQLGTDTSNRDL